MFGSTRDGMLPMSYQEQVVPVPFIWVKESLIKNEKLSGNAHLQGHQKLQIPPSSATCKCYLEMLQKF
jgi:hypothetical protein